MVDIYQDMVQFRGVVYSSDCIKLWSYYWELIDQSDGCLYGNFCWWGDVILEVQLWVIDMIIELVCEKGLILCEMVYVLVIVCVELGFNFDVVVGIILVLGLGQFIDKIGNYYYFNNCNCFDVGVQFDVLVDYYIDNCMLVYKCGQGEEYIYKYYYDGLICDYGGFILFEKKVMLYVDKYEWFVEQCLGLIQGQFYGSYVVFIVVVVMYVQVKLVVVYVEGQICNFEQMMQVMLFLQNGVKLYIIGEFGEYCVYKLYGGIDFNYVGGQYGCNLQYLIVNVLIFGMVMFVGGDYGMVKIRDVQGNLYEILYLYLIQVKEGQLIKVGELIGIMGGCGLGGVGQYVQYVYYQLKDLYGKLFSLQDFWDYGKLKEIGKGGYLYDVDYNGVLCQGVKGEEVIVLQKEFNCLGVCDGYGNLLSEDGKFGVNIRDVLIVYQKQYGFFVDGVVGLVMLGKLVEGCSYVEVVLKGL